MLEIGGLYKVFGEHPHAVVDALKRGEQREMIRRQLGGVVALEDINLKIEKGELHILMGLSGSGKSTLIRCINRLIEPTAGSVHISGKDVIAFDADKLQAMRRSQLAMVFQGFGLYPHMTVAENVAYPLKIRGESADACTRKAGSALEVVGLSAWHDSYPEMLSGGMRQRVGLARALATDAEILFMDEPFSALDPLIRRDLQSELLELQARLRKTIVFVTHDFQEAARIGTNITVLQHGSVIQSGSPGELIFNPLNDYIANFSQGINLMEHCRARDLMSAPASCGELEDAPEVDESMLLKQMCGMLATSELMKVTGNNGDVIGVISRVDVLKTLAEAN
ncbi:ATP-binding cassette domain-containing protein [Caballeronia sp. LjRoot34]|uniref:ATP-binding cassette domain-containing protein n=1 Tax=Caballeronia sp. LjRoot34 TaxID=3342325 RepID=UPI003ED0CF84